MKIMPINELPKYLKSLRSGTPPDNNVVVDMGSLQNNRVFRTLSNFAAICALCLFLASGSIVTYRNFSSTNITVRMDTTNLSSNDVTGLINQYGATVLSVTPSTSNIYVVKIKINGFKNIKLFLESLRNQRNVSKVQLEE